MGRKKKYQTEEERKQANNERRMKHYRANRIEEQKKALERYHQNKKDVPVNNPKPTVYNGPIEEVEEDITFEAFEDESTSHYQSEII